MAVHPPSSLIGTLRLLDLHGERREFLKKDDPSTYSCRHRKSEEAILYEIYSREFRRKNTGIFTFQFYSSCWSEFLRSIQ